MPLQLMCWSACSLFPDSPNFRVHASNTLDNGALQFPSGDTFMTVALSTNSGAPSTEIEFVMGEAGVFVGGSSTNALYQYQYTFLD